MATAEAVMAKKPERPKERKEERVVFMAEKTFVDELETAANAQRMTPSQYIRWAILNQIRRDAKGEE